MIAPPAPRILIAGGGYVGLYAALALQERLKPGQAAVTLVSPENYMTYQPLLPEVASGTLEPRHAVVPLRRALRRTQLVTGRLRTLDHGGRTATVVLRTGEERQLEYDHVVLGLGGVSRVLPVPGLRERAIGFQTLRESIALRNLVLERMEVAEATPDPRLRRRALTFVFVGGGYTGVEVLAELQDMASSVARFYANVAPGDLRWLLVEATGRLLPTVDRGLADYAARLLRERGVDLRLETTVEAVDGTRVTLSTGEDVEADTLVWVTGVRPSALVGELGLPTSDDGRVAVDPELRVRGVDGAWAAGDCAAVPDLVTGGTCPPTAQYAERQGRHLGANLATVVAGGAPEPFRYASKGEFVTLGRHKAIAQVSGRHYHGLPVWLLRRAYYGSRIPTANRKLRLLADWLAGAPFHHDVVQVGTSQDPRAPFVAAANTDDAG